MHRYEFGVIGNCSWMAFIDKRGHVNWLCMPRFDSSFLFGSLVAGQLGGEFSIQPGVESFTSHQYYQENTNILITEFTTSEGQFRVTDFAPRFEQNGRHFKPTMLIRKVEPLSGRSTIKVKCQPVGDYGHVHPEVVAGSNHLRFLHLETQVRLTTNMPLAYILEGTAAVLSEPLYLVLTYGLPLEGPLEETVEQFLKKTTHYWNDWVKSTSIPNLYQREIIRAALVLKLHQYEDTGGIIASGSTSLPEYPGSGRNWDYRYCWLRDAFYTLKALNSLGHFEELEKYFHYIEHIIDKHRGRIQPLYTITGGQDVVERETDLAGYLDNRPVRIGNEAYTHIQNDVYGQVLVSLQPLYTDQRLIASRRSKSLSLVHFLLDKIAETMDQKDAGLWEFRNKQQLHCFTFLFHWAGSKAAAKIGKAFGDDALQRKALVLEAEAARRIEQCYNSKRGVYTQAIGSAELDASCLQLITMNYLDPQSERARKHLEVIENTLGTKEYLVYRYTHADDFGKPESTFLVCAFWYAEALACVGRHDDAIKALNRLVGYANHLGIFSEDVDTQGGQWGNFPQTYSHVGLMNSAFRIARKVDEPPFF